MRFQVSKTILQHIDIDIDIFAGLANLTGKTPVGIMGMVLLQCSTKNNCVRIVACVSAQSKKTMVDFTGIIGIIWSIIPRKHSSNFWYFVAKLYQHHFHPVAMFWWKKGARFQRNVQLMHVSFSASKGTQSTVVAGCMHVCMDHGLCRIKTNQMRYFSELEPPNVWKLTSAKICNITDFWNNHRSSTCISSTKDSGIGQLHFHTGTLWDAFVRHWCLMNFWYLVCW